MIWDQRGGNLENEVNWDDNVESGWKRMAVRLVVMPVSVFLTLEMLTAYCIFVSQFLSF